MQVRASKSTSVTHCSLVAKGHTPGIYFSKKAVMKEVSGFDSPVFAKVLTMEAAKKFLSEFTPEKDLERGEN